MFARHLHLRELSPIHGILDFLNLEPSEPQLYIGKKIGSKLESIAHELKDSSLSFPLFTDAEFAKPAN